MANGFHQAQISAFRITHFIIVSGFLDIDGQIVELGIRRDSWWLVFEILLAERLGAEVAGLEYDGLDLRLRPLLGHMPPRSPLQAAGWKLR